MHIQYGCGLSAPKEWINFDSSPTLKLQRLPFLGFFFKKLVSPEFPKNIKYGDITKCLPGIKPNSCEGVYCSHVLEHLSLEDFRTAIRKTYEILESGGIFRLVMPDLNALIRSYLDNKEANNAEASVRFIKNSGMGTEYSRKSIKNRIMDVYGNSKHLWLWDKEATIYELNKAGFKKIRICSFNDSSDPMFKLVEDPDRFNGAMAIEAIK